MEALIEILGTLASTLLSGGILSILWWIGSIIFFDESSETAVFFAKILIPNGSCACGWFYLLSYKDIVGKCFPIFCIILGFITVIVCVYILITTYKMLIK